MIFNKCGGLPAFCIKQTTQSSRTAITNLVISRGLKRLGYGRYLSVSRYRMRKGLPPAPTASGPLTDDPDWSYLDGTPGQMTRGQTSRYLRDQDMGRTMVKFNEQFKAVEEMRKAKQLEKQQQEQMTQVESGNH